jgi:DNA polymerase-3 subunit delta'
MDSKINMNKKMSAKNIGSEIVGHDSTIEKLKNMIRAGRMPGCMLFVGAPEQGKKMVATYLAQILLCEQKPSEEKKIVAVPADACGVCSSCLRVAKNQSEGLMILAPEKGVIKIEAAMAVVRQLSLSAWGRARVVIIDDAHLLNPQAANALLKSIEEPPPHTYFVLISSSQESVLKTLRSRSQIVRFKSLNIVEANKIGRSDLATEDTDSAFALLRTIVLDEPTIALAQMREVVTDKEVFQNFLILWHEMVRDIWVTSVSQNVSQNVKSGRFHYNYSEFSRVDKSQLSILSENILSTQKDLMGNCDLNITMDYFFNETRGALT